MGAVIALAMSAPSRAQPAPRGAPPPLQLTAAARQTLEQLACLGPHQQPLQDIQARGIPAGQAARASVIEAEVRCQPHGEVQGTPLHFLHVCDDTGHQWHCSQAFVEFSTHLNGREVLLSAADLAPDEMLAMAKSVGIAAVIPAPTDAAAPAAGPAHCRIAPRPGADPELYRFSCDVWELLVVRRCRQGRCSYRAIDRGAPLF